MPEPPASPRGPIAVALAALGLSWLAMMALHETGHVGAAVLTGGSVERVVLDPLALSRTDLARNPAPGLVAAGGFAGGVLLAALLPLLVPASRVALRQLARFFAGFCLVANGTYLIGGALLGAGDPADLIRAGHAPIGLIAVGALLLALGLARWHRLGPGLGFGVHAGPHSRWTALTLLLLLAMAAAVGRLLFPAR